MSSILRIVVRRRLFVGNGRLDCVRFQIPAVRTTKRRNWNKLICLHLETHPEGRLGLPGRPVFLLVSRMSEIRDVASFHLRVTPDALDGSVHIYVSRQKQLPRMVSYSNFARRDYSRQTIHGRYSSRKNALLNCSHAEVRNHHPNYRTSHSVAVCMCTSNWL
jgi:hypothetical protein